MLQCITCGRNLTQLQSGGGDCPSCGTPIPAMVASSVTPPIPTSVPVAAPTPSVAAMPAPVSTVSPLATLPQPTIPPTQLDTPSGNRGGLGLWLTLAAILIVVLLGLIVLGKTGAGPFTGFFS